LSRTASSKQTFSRPTTSGSGATRRTHVWGLDISESRRGAGGLGGLLWLNTATNGTHVAAYDGNGSVLGLIGTSGQVTARYEYGPFGELLRMSGDALAADNPWRWGTKRVDPTTDLVHYEYRVYSPRLGRWLSRDPIGEAGGRNLYAFAGNDPVNSQDVLGLFSWFGGSEPQQGSPGGNMGPSDGGRMESLMRSFVRCACSAVDGFFKGFDETVEMLKSGWSLAKDAWNSAFGSAELKAEAMQRNRDRWQNMVQAFQDFVEMMRDPNLMELIEKFFPPEFLILLREPIGSPKFCETLGKLGFNALMDALIGLASGGALTAIKKAMEKGGEALKGAIEAAGKHVRKCTNCFVAGTLVATACGLVPIEDLQAGDWVWARDEVTGDVRLCEVEGTYRNESPVILEVTAGGETLATTPGHPFWVQDVGWKDAGDLEVGDRLVNLRGESVVVEDIRRRPVPEPVFNFSVAGLHTYFVGQGGIWVHNNSGTGCGVPGNAGRVTPNPSTGVGYGVTDPPVRIQGTWTEPDIQAALRGRPPASLGSPDLHHAGQMPGSAIHEIVPGLHQGNKALHPNKYNQGVTGEMRRQDRQLHWWYRAREQGADRLFPGEIYD
jgi:RHS repeat-associated protein